MPMDAGPSLVLGAYETQPLELASAFGAFANHGVLARPRAIKKVLDKEGTLLERRSMDLEQAISPEVAYVITSLLQGVFERGTARSVSGKIQGPGGGEDRDDQRELGCLVCRVYASIDCTGLGGL